MKPSTFQGLSRFRRISPKSTESTYEIVLKPFCSLQPIPVTGDLVAAVGPIALVAVLEVDLEGGLRVVVNGLHVVGQQVAPLRLLLVVTAEPVLGAQVLEVLRDLIK